MLHTKLRYFLSMFTSVLCILHIFYTSVRVQNRLLTIFLYLIFHMLIQNISISYTKDVFMITPGSESCDNFSADTQYRE